MPADQLAAVATGFGMEGTSIGGALDRAAEAGQFAVDKLCAQTLFTGEFDPVVVNFPLGIGDVTTFPGYNEAVFPGIAAAC